MTSSLALQGDPGQGAQGSLQEAVWQPRGMELSSAPFLQHLGEQDKIFQSHPNPLLHNPALILDHLEKTKEE